MRLPLLGGAYAGFSSNVSSQEMINFYWEQPTKHELHAGSAVPTPGAIQFSTSFPDLIRGIFYNNYFQYLFVVSNNQVFRVDNAGNKTALSSTLDTTTGSVSWALDPTTGIMLLVDGTSGYKIDAGNITKIVDPDFPVHPTACGYIDGFFLVNAPNAQIGKFQWSSPNDCTTWDPLDTEVLLTLDTFIRQILVNGRDIWFFGNAKSEIWYFIGQDPDHPFQRIERIETGIPETIGLPCTLACLCDNSVMWVSETSRGEVQVVRANGYLPQVVSTPEISHKMQGAFHTGGANPLYHTYVKMWKGHEFFTIWLGTIGTTLVYDASTNEWSQLSGTFNNNNPTKSPYVFFAFCVNWDHRYIVADSQNLKLWYQSDTAYTHDGTLIERRITGPMIALENEAKLRIVEVQLDIEESTLGATDPISEGIIHLSYSKDGGHTYSAGKDLYIGNIGVGQSYHTRLRKTKFGWAHLWNFRIYTNAKHKVVIKGMYGRMAQEPYTGFQQASAGQTSQPLKQ